MRLFWRILAGYFVAWVLLTLVLFGVLALDSRTPFLPRAPVSQSLPSAVGVQIAWSHLKTGGIEVFRRVARQWEESDPPLVVDAEGRDLLGRTVDPETLTVARSLASNSPERAPVKSVTTPGANHLVIYFPSGRAPSDQMTFGWLVEHPRFLGIFFAVVGVALAGGLTAFWTRPIAALERAFDAFGEEGKEPTLDPGIARRRDEIGDLGRHFEDMALRLSRSMRSQRQLLHDVSHEVRSPLARLSVATELARRRPERLGEALDRIERDCKRLDRLMGELLTLARLEGDGEVALDDYFDLLELLRVIRDAVAFEAEAVGIEVDLRIPELGELVMNGNAELLHRAIENVVRNALQHAGAARRIDIVLETRSPSRTGTPAVDHPSTEREGSVLLRVRDYGEGIEETQLASLFEPFARGGQSSGSGLGLAIAHRAVLVHGGSISADNLAEGGVEVQIVLPLGHVV